MKKGLILSLNGMGFGLLATLVVGTILTQIGQVLDLEVVTTIGSFAKVFMAAAIGAGVASALKANPYILFSAIVTASIGAGAIQAQEGMMLLGVGEPAGAYVAALVTVVIGQLVSGKTKLDILLVPMICLMVGGTVGLFISPTVSQFTALIGHFINEATNWQPLLMGATISVTMSLVILSPISSAALAASLGLSGLAAGAAVVGCSCSMIGFAVASFQDNGVQGLITQGIGTSKVQFSNTVKNPSIALPATVSALLAGMLSTTLFKMQCNALGAGMGASGLVGQLQTLAVMGKDGLLGIIILHFLLPALVSYRYVTYLKKRQFIKRGDMALSTI